MCYFPLQNPVGWGIRKPRTERFEVDQFGNLVPPRENRVLPKENRVVPKDSFLEREEILEEKLKRLGSFGDDDDAEWAEKTERSSSAAKNLGLKVKKIGKDKKKIKKLKVEDDGPQPPPPMPQEFKNRILELFGESSVTSERLVMQKRVQKSDIDKGKNRLSIPEGKTRFAFLEGSEKQKLPMNCRIIEPNLGESEVKLSGWSIFHALNGGWNEVKIRNSIVTGLILQLWALRVDGVLTFVLVDITTPEEKEKCVQRAIQAAEFPY